MSFSRAGRIGVRDADDGAGCRFLHLSPLSRAGTVVQISQRKTEAGTLSCLDLDEEAPLPEGMRVGSVFYDDLVHGQRQT